MASREHLADSIIAGRVQIQNDVLGSLRPKFDLWHTGRRLPLPQIWDGWTDGRII